MKGNNWKIVNNVNRHSLSSRFFLLCIKPKAPSYKKGGKDITWTTKRIIVAKHITVASQQNNYTGRQS